MEKAFTIKSKVFRFSDDDVKKAASGMISGQVDRTRFYAKVQGKPYPARQLVIEMVRKKGETVPDLITYQAIRILRALSFEIMES